MIVNLKWRLQAVLIISRLGAWWNKILLNSVQNQNEMIIKKMMTQKLMSLLTPPKLQMLPRTDQNLIQFLQRAKSKRQYLILFLERELRAGDQGSSSKTSFPTPTQATVHHSWHKILNISDGRWYCCIFDFMLIQMTLYSKFLPLQTWLGPYNRLKYIVKAVIQSCTILS